MSNQQMEQKLTKPVFVKLSELENGRGGYNVYVKVVSVQTPQTKQGGQPIARAVVADQSAYANAFFKGDNAKLIKEGAVIAIRNGMIKFIKNKISLEVDMFGRVTPQTVAIKSANTENNISEKEHERKPRRNNRDQREPRGQHRQHRGQHRGQNRGQHRGQHREHRQHRGGERRGGDRDFDRRQRRQDNGDRRPRREDNERRPRRDFQERPRRDFQERPRREQGERRPRREFEERAPRRQEDRGNRRPPTVFTKIGAIEPGDENLNIFAQVVKCQDVGKRARVVLGDQTGLIKAFLYKTDKIVVGNTIVLFKGQAKVVKQHIELQVAEGGKVDEARKKITQVQKSVDISAKEWVQAD